LKVLLKLSNNSNFEFVWVLVQSHIIIEIQGNNRTHQKYNTKSNYVLQVNPVLPAYVKNSDVHYKCFFNAIKYQKANMFFFKSGDTDLNSMAASTFTLCKILFSCGRCG
jgi:hypothetical protein